MSFFFFDLKSILADFILLKLKYKDRIAKASAGERVNIQTPLFSRRLTNNMSWILLKLN